MRTMTYQGTLQLYYYIGSLITMTFVPSSFHPTIIIIPQINVYIPPHLFLSSLHQSAFKIIKYYINWLIFIYTLLLLHVLCNPFLIQFSCINYVTQCHVHPPSISNTITLPYTICNLSIYHTLFSIPYSHLPPHILAPVSYTSHSQPCNCF